MAANVGFVSRFVRTLGFVRKELWTVLRQPRLILTLVVGPFLILLLFGLGYTQTIDPFRTLLVLKSSEARLATNVQDLSDAFSPSIDLVGVITDPAEGIDKLQRDEIDLLVIAPEDPMASLEKGETADFTVMHREVDPFVRRSIGLISNLSVDEMNRQVLADLIGELQQESEDVDSPVTGLSAAASALVDSLESGDDAGARQARADLQSQLEAAGGADSSTAFYRGVARALGVSAGTVAGGLISDLEGTDPGDDRALENALALQADVTQFERQLNEAQDIDPALVVSPFDATVEAIQDFPTEPAVFYAPGVLMLLVQHLAVTFAALSLVRERQLGVTEVFRVSPLSVGEAMVGKYVAFFIIVGSVAAVLSGLMFLFGVPMAGSPWLYVGALSLVLLASLGLGFMISGVSHTDNQAIQYSMIILLVTIFFSGFIIPLDRLLAPVQVVSYALPATLGISASHDVLFLGSAPSVPIQAGLAGYVVVGAILAWIVARRDVAL